MTEVTNKLNTNSVQDWFRLIAKKSNCDIAEVKQVLNKYNIEPQSTTAISKQFKFESIEFSGKKEGTSDDKDFKFIWEGLDTGLYGVLSDDNSVGKSSILKILHSVLRGNFSKVSEVIFSWINQLKTEFSIGNNKFEFKFIRTDLELIATLYKYNNSLKIEIYNGPLNDLSEVIDQIYMKELNFEKMYSTKESKTLIQHGWPALASALFISSAHGPIVGDLALSGLPQRLLQLFIGLPWISTHSMASAVFKIESSNINSKLKSSDNKIAQSITRLQNELNSLPEIMDSENERRKDKIIFHKLENEIEKLNYNRSELKISIGEITSDTTILNRELIKLRRDLQSIDDNNSAGFIFRKLQPICCPACESTKFKALKIESNSNVICPLCKDESLLTDTDNDISDSTGISEEIDILNQQISKLKNDLSISKIDLNENKLNISEKQQSMKIINEKDKTNKSTDVIRNRRLSIDNTIEELKLLQSSASPDESNSKNELTILKAAKLETHKMYQEKEKELFESASKMIKATASKLGVKHLKNIIWTSTKMKIEIANKSITYSKLSDGEKLRFRIAASVTMAQLSAETGIGRHPGVLFFDSPKAEEITASDFHEIVSAITDIADENKGLQIFLASRLTSEFEERNVFKDIKRAKGIDFLF